LTNCTIVGNVATNAGGGKARGGGIYFYSSGLILNCVISNNLATSSDTRGGGIYITSGTTDTRVQDCDIVNNEASNYGGGILMGGGIVTNCLIKDNRLSSGNNWGGGGVWMGGVLANCRIINNNSGSGGAGGGVLIIGNSQILGCSVISNRSGQYGGGIHRKYAGSLVRNCLIAGNVGRYGGGLSGVITAINCTVVSNRATSYSGGIYCIDRASIINCVIYTNLVVNGTDHNWANNGTTMTYSNCCTWPTNGLPGSGNIEADPLLVNSDAGNFQLRGASPCVNAGLNQGWMSGTLDLGDQPRIRYNIVDIGAYETLLQGTIIKMY